MTHHSASQSYRSWCKVTWNAGNTNDYKVGHDGKLDVVMIEGASGGCYYPEHLASLGHYNSLPATGEQVRLMSSLPDQVSLNSLRSRGHIYQLPQIESNLFKNSFFNRSLLSYV